MSKAVQLDLFLDLGAIHLPCAKHRRRLTPRVVFGSCRRLAERGGIPFLFTFEEWWAWWQVDNRWDKRGLRRDCLMMVRIDRSGPWALSNVACAAGGQPGRSYKEAYSGLPHAARDAFLAHRASARERDIPFLFTFEEWWAWWQVDNRWDKRGRGRDCLRMVRVDRAGPWALSNVACESKRQPFLKEYVGVPRAVVVAFSSHRSRARRRDIEFLFTFEEWWAWWQVDNRWANRGNGRDNFVMARFGDRGPYSVSNVYCATVSQNGSDALRNRPFHGRAVVTPDGRFPSVASASRHHGVNAKTAWHYLRRSVHGWRFAEPLGLETGRFSGVR